MILSCIIRRKHSYKNERGGQNRPKKREKNKIKRILPKDEKRRKISLKPIYQVRFYWHLIPVFMDLNIEEAENLLIIFGARFEKDRSPYKLIIRVWKYGILISTLEVIILFTKVLTLLLLTTNNKCRESLE